MNLLGFGMDFFWELTWSLGLLGGSTSANGNISGTDLALTMAFSETDGKPSLAVSTDSVSIGHLVSGVWEELPDFIAQYLDDALAEIISYALESQIKEIANSDLQKLIDTHWNNTLVILPYNISIDYALSQPPDFFSEFFSIFVEADVTFGSDAKCPFSTPQFPPVSNDLQIDFALSKLQCAFFNANEAKFIDHTLNYFLDKLNITFHDKVSIDIDLLSVPSMLFYGELMVNTTLPVGVTISSADKQLLELFMNASVSAGVDLNLRVNDSSIAVLLSTLEVSALGHGVVSDAIPQKYRNQLNDAKMWKALVTKINTLITTNLHLPKKIVHEVPILDTLALIFPKVSIIDNGGFIQVSGKI